MGLARRLSALGLLLLLRALLVCTQSQDQESVFAIVGEDFTFSPKVNGTIKEITWMKRKDKVAEWEGGVGSPTYYSSLAERGKLETSSGNFTIKKLNAGDAAEYEAQVLPGNDGPLQYTKFILEVLDPPPPSVLNCSVTNGQIRISCAIQFSKDVHYSWYRNDRKIDANSPVLELKENADPSGKVLCVREVSKTKINDSISLSACFPESDKSISRGRDGLIAIFVILLLLLLFMGALFVLWKRGLLSSILRRIPTKHSAVYKPEEQHLTDDDRFPEESGQTEGYTPADPEYENSRDFEVAAHQSGEAAKSMQVGEDVRVSLQDSNESQAERGSHKKEGNLFHTWTKKIRGNIDRVRSSQTHKTDEEKSSKETESMNQPDPPSNEENPEEKKNSKETVSTSQADLSSNKENPDYENISKENQEPDEEKSSKETESMNKPDLPSNEENPDSENISSRNQKPEEKKNSKDTVSMSQADLSSNEETPDSENISSRNQKPELKAKSMNLPDLLFNQEKTDLKLQSEAD
ncbi:lymphocyte function-associated antigen 3 isoform X5 [Mauremys mutica]|uniref:lymphocyte function-associated antigen 3 isoform X5 n=1 Tax=Mauremys mutica TaxID=74926 RepID=UPI001D134A5D|nr:lymphocyte function-associated antigen 3 isoform X5 [Mauremys mutica]